LLNLKREKEFFNLRNVDYEGYQREVTNRFYFEDGGRLHEGGEYFSCNRSQLRNVRVKEVPITPGGNSAVLLLHAGQEILPWPMRTCAMHITVAPDI
jgi:hypothetical protein